MKTFLFVVFLFIMGVIGAFGAFLYMLGEVWK